MSAPPKAVEPRPLADIPRQAKSAPDAMITMLSVAIVGISITAAAVLGVLWLIAGQ